MSKNHIKLNTRKQNDCLNDLTLRKIHQMELVIDLIFKSTLYKDRELCFCEIQLRSTNSQDGITLFFNTQSYKLVIFQCEWLKTKKGVKKWISIKNWNEPTVDFVRSLDVKRQHEKLLDYKDEKVWGSTKDMSGNLDKW